MYPRIIQKESSRSFFLFGPRGTGKSSWLKTNFSKATYIDLLDDETFRYLLAAPERLKSLINPKEKWVVIDEVQRIPNLLNEVHRLIESSTYLFVLSGSSARKLKREGANLLAGRALTNFLHPFTVQELGNDFNIEKALNYGMLPEVWDRKDNHKYLQSYITTYLKEEIQQEGITRNIGTFSRFLEAASFSQASPLNVSEIARDFGADNKTAENYFTILEDLLLAYRLPVFTKHAKRKMYARSKFLFFDVGVYRSIRPKGPLDTPELIDGAALETLLFQELKALNDYLNLEFGFYYWRTQDQHEIDFILYGEKGLFAFEVKRSKEIRKKDIRALTLFLKDYPIAKAVILYGGTIRKYVDGIELIPFEEGLKSLENIIAIR